MDLVAMPFRRQRQHAKLKITIAADITLHDIVNGKELIATFRYEYGGKIKRLQ